MTYRELLGPQKNSGLLDVVTLGILFQAIAALVLSIIAWHIPADTNFGIFCIVATISSLVYVIYSIIKSVRIADALRAADNSHDEHCWLMLHQPESDAIVSHADNWILRYSKTAFSQHHAKKMRRIVKLRDKAASFDIYSFDEKSSVAYLELKAELEAE